jgi:hypothetical protein
VPPVLGLLILNFSFLKVVNEYLKYTHVLLLWCIGKVRLLGFSLYSSHSEDEMMSEVILTSCLSLVLGVQGSGLF